ncbi:MAG: hypothetical protein ACRD2L_00890 [Terriglobia bacterium]
MRFPAYLGLVLWTCSCNANSRRQELSDPCLFETLVTAGARAVEAKRDVSMGVLDSLSSLIKRHEPFRSGEASEDLAVINRDVDSLLGLEAPYALLALATDTIAFPDAQEIILKARAADLLVLRPNGLRILDDQLSAQAERLSEARQLSIRMVGQFLTLGDALFRLRLRGSNLSPGVVRSLCSLRAAHPQPGDARTEVEALRRRISAMLLVFLEQSSRDWTSSVTDNYLGFWSPQDQEVLRAELSRLHKRPRP